MSRIKAMFSNFFKCKKLEFQKLLSRRLVNGSLGIVFPGGQRLVIRGDQKESIAAHAQVKSWKAVCSFLLEGVSGLGDSFIKGHWESDDLSMFLKYGVSNRSGLKGVLRGLNIFRLAAKIRHLSRRNSEQGSQKNIAYHYDLGNEFYKLWLDRTMTYSSALFRSNRDTLESAQENKYRELSALVEIDRSSRVLEIGCGWGGFISHMVRQHDCEITGITISKQQFIYVDRLIKTQKLRPHATVEFRDYRNINERYDKIVSIEMIEAVGEQYWPLFFEKLKSLLRPNGDIAIQLITINEKLFPQYRKNPDFIQKYIFPGGMLMTSDLLEEISDSVGLRLVETNHFARDYAKTLRLWKNRFNAAWPELRRMGFDQRFQRMWNFYLSYCEAGFEEGLIDVSQVRIVHAS